MEEAVPARDDPGREVFIVPGSATFGSWPIRVTYACLFLNGVLQVFLQHDLFRWLLLISLALPVGLLPLMAYRQRRDPPRLILDEGGIAVAGAWTRARAASWGEVENVHIDPPGGTRTVRVLRRGGRWETFQAIRSEDVPRLQHRWDAVRRARAA